MENNLVRTEQILGTYKNVIGDYKSDLVLESFSKIYIKTGQKTRLLDDVFKLLDSINLNTDAGKIITTNNIQLLNYPGDGYLVFDTNNSALYISYDYRYLLVSDNLDQHKQLQGDYVKKTGDTMTGQLVINHKGAPLLVASSDLVRNFNANYLNGRTDDEFAKRKLNEYIYGHWTFEGNNVFNGSTTFNNKIDANDDVVTNKSLIANGTIVANKDIIAKESIGSEYFASGYHGSGWRLEKDTNTLTIDYLVVRKAMMVYELIINRIRATNGSLWVTDSSEIQKAHLATAEPLGLNMWKYLETVNNELKFQNYDKSTDEFGENLTKTIVGESIIDITNVLLPGIVIMENNVSVFKNVYNEYFAKGKIYTVYTNTDTTADLQQGDLIRCQKFHEKGMKYYDGLVLAVLSYGVYAIQIADSVFDKYTEIEYDENGNITNFTESINTKLENEDGLLATPYEKDVIVRIGNVCNPDRQNSVYITSADQNSPYIQTMSDVNIPDYGVVYKYVDFKKVNNRYIDVNGNIYDYITSDNYENLVLTTEGTISNTVDIPTIYNKLIKARFGKLDGIVEESWDKQPHGYGLFSDNVFLKGEFYLNNGQTVVEFTKEQARIESERISFKAASKIDNLFYSCDGDDYSKELPNPNLFRNTNYDLYNADGTKLNVWKTGSESEYLDGSYVADDTLKGYNALNKTLTSAGSITTTEAQSVNLKKGKTYTLSCYSKFTGDRPTDSTTVDQYIYGMVFTGTTADKFTYVSSNNIYHTNINSPSSTASVEFYFGDQGQKDNWIRHSITFTVKEDVSTIKIKFHCWSANSEGTTFYYSQLKLEEGDKVTPYCKNYMDYVEGNPSTFKDDCGKWIPIDGDLYKSEQVDTSGVSYIEGSGLSFISISNKQVKLTKGQTLDVQLDCILKEGNPKLTLYVIKDESLVKIQELVLENGENIYTFVNTYEGEAYLALSISSDQEFKLLFSRELVSNIRTRTESQYTQLENGFEQRVGDLEGNQAVVTHTINEWSTKVGYSYQLFETPSLATALSKGWVTSDSTVMNAIQYDKLFIKTDTLSVSRNLAYNFNIVWKDGITTLTTTTQGSAIYFKVPYQLNKGDKLEITFAKLTADQTRFDILDENDIVLARSAYIDTDASDEVDYTLTLTLNDTLKEDQIYRLHLDDDTTIQYPITTNIDIFEGSSLQVLKDKIKLDTDELEVNTPGGEVSINSNDIDEIQSINYWESTATSVDISGWGQNIEVSGAFIVDYSKIYYNNSNKVPIWFVNGFDLVEPLPYVLNDTGSANHTNYISGHNVYVRRVESAEGVEVFPAVYENISGYYYTVRGNQSGTPLDYTNTTLYANVDGVYYKANAYAYRPEDGILTLGVTGGSGNYTFSLKGQSFIVSEDVGSYTAQKQRPTRIMYQGYERLLYNNNGDTSGLPSQVPYYINLNSNWITYWLFKCGAMTDNVYIENVLVNNTQVYFHLITDKDSLVFNKLNNEIKLKHNDYFIIWTDYITSYVCQLTVTSRKDKPTEAALITQIKPNGIHMDNDTFQFSVIKNEFVMSYPNKQIKINSNGMFLYILNPEIEISKEKFNINLKQTEYPIHLWDNLINGNS